MLRSNQDFTLSVIVPLVRRGNKVAGVCPIGVTIVTSNPSRIGSEPICVVVRTWTSTERAWWNETSVRRTSVVVGLGWHEFRKMGTGLRWIWLGRWRHIRPSISPEEMLIGIKEGWEGRSIIVRWRVGWKVVELFTVSQIPR